MYIPYYQDTFFSSTEQIFPLNIKRNTADGMGMPVVNGDEDVVDVLHFSMLPKVCEERRNVVEDINLTLRETHRDGTSRLTSR